MAIDKKDFDPFLVEDDLHVAISAKDFKAAVVHAETLDVKVAARYSRPFRPLQLSYESDGIRTEFTLMTRGEEGEEDRADEASSSHRNSAAAPRILAASRETRAEHDEEDAPVRGRKPRPLVGTTAARVEHDNLFVPADDDRQWDEPEQETGEDALGWDATGEVRIHICPLLHIYPSRVASNPRLIGYGFRTAST